MTEQTLPATEPLSALGFTLRLIDNLWRALIQPWLPLLCIGLIGILMVAALLLPQLPAQLAEDPASAARWLSATAADYNLTGGALASLGMFNAMNSLLWRFVTVALALLLLLHLLRLWLFERQIVAASKALAGSAANATEPLELPTHPPPHAKRFVSSLPPQETVNQIVGRLKASFEQVQQWQPAPDPAVDADAKPPDAVLRSFAVRGRLALRLRMLLLLGGILASGALWGLNVAGWRIQTTALAPLDRFRDDWRNVAVDFSVKEGSPVLVVQQGEIRSEFPVTGTTTGQGMGAVHLVVGPPALLIQSLSPNAELKRPDGASSTAAGLLFPTPGSEETLLLPQQETALRIVRRTDAAPLNFTIEAIQAGIDETTRFNIDSDEQRTLQLGNSEVVLRFLPLYSRSVEVLFLPRLWLLWLAGLLTLVGLIGLRQKPGFALVQVAPWPVERSVVVIQTSDRENVEVVQQQLSIAYADLDKK